MPNVFDLSKVSRLVESQHPARILAMDTNILMDDPDPSHWSVKAEGQSLFVLSDTLIQELELIRQRKGGSKERAESGDKAAKSIKSMASLFEQGTITEGIPVKAGWVIAVPSPRKDQLGPELEQLEDIVRAFNRSDTKLLLLTRECHQRFGHTSVTLLTRDSGLYAVVQMQGLPSHLWDGFPIEELKGVAAQTKTVDWEQVLQEIQSDTRQKAILVDATLTTQRTSPPWFTLVTDTSMIAEGRGVMRAGDSVRPFLWTIRFLPQTLGALLSGDNKGPTDLPSIYLDFLGDEDFEQDLFDAIADRLLDCADMSFTEGTPTLQNQKSVMEMLLYVEYLFRKGVSEGALERLRREIEESGGLIHYWTDWILGLEDEDEQIACLEGFIQALDDCWKIGQTYKFSIMREQNEHLA